MASSVQTVIDVVPLRDESLSLSMIHTAQQKSAPEFNKRV